MRHTERHAPDSRKPSRARSGKSARRSSASGAAAAAPGLKRVATCPTALAPAAAAGLVSQQYARRNHRPFLELYELGRVIGTGGYAVVRECVHRATGERFAAKMMTVSEDPASGGRDIDKQARTAAAALLTACTALC